MSFVGVTLVISSEMILMTCMQNMYTINISMPEMPVLKIKVAESIKWRNGIHCMLYCIVYLFTQYIQVRNWLAYYMLIVCGNILCEYQFQMWVNATYHVLSNIRFILDQWSAKWPVMFIFSHMHFKYMQHSKYKIVWFKECKTLYYIVIISTFMFQTVGHHIVCSIARCYIYQT